MLPKPSQPSSPPVHRPFARLSVLGILFLLLLADQGCGGNQADKAFERGLEAVRTHNYDLAIGEFSEAIRLKPDFEEAYYNRGHAYSDKGDYDKAIADFSEAIRLDPEDASIYNIRGDAYSKKGQNGRAIADFDKAIHLNPENASAYDRRGHVYDRKGDYSKAMTDYSEAIRLKPDQAHAYNSLAWLLAVCPDASIRNGEKAVKYAKKACELSEWKTPADLDTLAAAYAEVGDFDDAVKWENKYLESNPPSNSYDTPEKARQRLSLYEQKKPYHEEKP
jgi:tetratricopeptide (TPR) repeat protein